MQRRRSPGRATRVPSSTIRKCYRRHLGQLVHGRAQSGVQRACTLHGRAGRPGHTVAREPRCHRCQHAEPARRVARRGHRLRSLLRERHARRRARGAARHRARACRARAVVAVPSVDREPGLRHPGGAGRAQARQLPQHHAGGPAARLGARGGLRGGAGAHAARSSGAAEPLCRGGLLLQRVRAAGARLRGDRRRPAADRHARQERGARPRAGGRTGAAQGTRGRGRPALRGEDLAAQGPARPGQDARRPAPRRRPGGAPPSGGLAARRDLRARRCVRSSTSSGSTRR